MAAVGEIRPHRGQGPSGRCERAGHYGIVTIGPWSRCGSLIIGIQVR